MVTRKKVELLPTIKPNEDEDNPENTFVLNKGETLQCTIKDVRDVPTKFGGKIVVIVENSEGVRYNIFLNAVSQNKLIDSFGESDENWKGKLVDLKNEKDTRFKKDMIVVHPVK